jgi:hypothetical protein
LCVELDVHIVQQRCDQTVQVFEDRKPRPQETKGHIRQLLEAHVLVGSGLEHDGIQARGAHTQLVAQGLDQSDETFVVFERPAVWACALGGLLELLFQL